MSDETIDVRCLPYMPLQIERLRKSKAWLRCKRRPEMAFYLMNLWMRAWHEVPAGSIEDDDDILADAAMCSPEVWTSIKADVMQGWETRDGRVFHSTVTEIATDSAGKLRKNKNRTASARAALQDKRESTITEIVTEAVTEPVTDAVTETVTDIVTGPEGKGREEKGSKKEGGAGAPPDMAFVGQVIRLKAKDFQRWRVAYSAIPDLAAELTKADAYFVDHPPKDGKWFFPASKWLERGHTERLAKANAPDERQRREDEIYASLRE
jgi:uncharacterized protein YdaU (DUF1376 family)